MSGHFDRWEGTMTLEGRPVVFLDLEASSLGAGSHPIEVGWCAAGSDAPGSLLVRPAPAWDLPEHWSAASEAVHGIARERLLAEGLPPSEVVARLGAVFEGAVLASDDPAFDGYWLVMLREAAGRAPGWALRRAAAAWMAMGRERGLDDEGVKAAVRRAHWRHGPPPHRAGPDAAAAYAAAALLAAVARAVIAAAGAATVGRTGAKGGGRS